MSSDGTASQIVTVTINGTNDAPVIGGVAVGSVTEDVGLSGSNLVTSGALTIADVDQGQSNFTAQASTVATYGTFTLATNGSWTYTANDSQTAIQQLGAGQSITDSFTAVSSDGTASQVVTVTIHGTNDVPVIGGVSTGSVTEDVGLVGSNLATSGALTIADADQGQSNFTAQAGTIATYGSFTLATNGVWTYAASNSQTAIQQLGAGQSITDSFTAVSSDGTASQLVTVTIHGTNDVPVIAGVSTGSVTEDVGLVGSNLAASGADHRRRRPGPVQLHHPARNKQRRGRQRLRIALAVGDYGVPEGGIHRDQPQLGVESETKSVVLSIKLTGLPLPAL